MLIMNVYIAGACFWTILLCICMARCRDKGSLHSHKQLLEFENFGSLASTTYMDRLLKDKIRAESYQFVGKDVSAKSYIIEEAIPAEQQRRVNCSLQKDFFSKQSSVVRVSYMEGLKVRAWRRYFEPTATFAYRDFQGQRPTVVEKDTAEEE
jgi:hypothetical protein